MFELQKFPRSFFLNQHNNNEQRATTTGNGNLLPPAAAGARDMSRLEPQVYFFLFLLFYSIELMSIQTTLYSRWTTTTTKNNSKLEGLET